MRELANYFFYRVEVYPKNSALASSNELSRKAANVDDREINYHSASYFLVLSQEELTKKDFLSYDRNLYETIVSPNEFKNFSKLAEKNFFALTVLERSTKFGVTDNPARALENYFRIRGKKNIHASSGELFFIDYPVEKEKEALDLDQLANDLIHNIRLIPSREFLQNTARFVERKSFPSFFSEGGEKDRTGLVEEVPKEVFFSEIEKLKEWGDQKTLALSSDEWQHIKNYFSHPKRKAERKEKGLEAIPRDIEIEIIAQSWSEHCKHKIFGANVNYRESEHALEKKFESKIIKSLFQTYIREPSISVIEKKHRDRAISVFSDNAGIVRFRRNSHNDFCLKVETHNSPSALDPYGGSITGILGVNRDIMGTGIGAAPILNLDYFCFPPPELFNEESLLAPAGVKSPRTILRGVHRGVVDGGNKSGIPTLAGGLFFHRDFAGKPLVFVGTLGVLPRLINGRPSHQKKARPGDKIVMCGGRIGADGIHGATFSSLELNEKASRNAVQIGDPFTQKKLSDFLLSARDQALYSSITDNGAGGLSSSVGEMAKEAGGARLDLELCPLKYAGLAPWEIVVSEGQERMTVAVPPENLERFLMLSREMDLESTPIGEFNDSGAFSLFFKGRLIGELALDWLHNSLPPMELKAHFKGPSTRPQWSSLQGCRGRTPKEKKNTFKDFSSTLPTLLKSLNVSSRRPLTDSYDQGVGGATARRPFHGRTQGAPSDGTLISTDAWGEKDNSFVTISCGMAPLLSDYDPYLMAKYAIDECLRNALAAGANLEEIFFLDNFSWPDPVQSETNPQGEERLAALVRSLEAIKEFIEISELPFISGKDSMKNDFKGKNLAGEKISFGVPPTLLITALASAREINIKPSAFLEHHNSGIYLASFWPLEILCTRPPKLRASAIGEAFDLPPLFTNDAWGDFSQKEMFHYYQILFSDSAREYFESVHDVSDGGAAVSISESLFAPLNLSLGAEINLPFLPDDSNSEALSFLFSEYPGSFIISVKRKRRKSFQGFLEKSALSSHFTLLGETNTTGKLQFNFKTTKASFQVHELYKAFQTGEFARHLK